MGHKVSNFTIGKLTGSDHGVYAQWNNSRNSDTDHYEVEWKYTDGTRRKNAKGKMVTVFVPGSSSSMSTSEASVGGGVYRATYNAPDSAVVVQGRVMAVAAVSDKKAKFKAEWTSLKEYDFRTDKVATPTVSAEMDEGGTRCTVTVSCNDADAAYCDVSAKSGSSTVYSLKDKPMADGSATFNFAVTAGRTWNITARCKTSTDSSYSKATSNWSTAASVTARPGTVSGLVAKPYGSDGTGAKVTWNSVYGATSYTVEYVAGSRNYFGTSASRSQSGIEGTSFYPNDLDSGNTWYFRVKAVNSGGESPSWSNVGSCIAATRPDAPTTYDTEPALAIGGGSVRFRWTHNATDESEQTKYRVQVSQTYDESTSVLTTIQTTSGADYAMMSLNRNDLVDGATITWKVATVGAFSDSNGGWSPWSVTRSFKVYRSAGLTVELGKVSDGNVVPLGELSRLTSFPLVVQLTSDGGGGEVSGYHVSVIVANSTEYRDMYGNTVNVTAGDIVYEKDAVFFADPGSSTFTMQIGADSGLADSVGYHVVADVSMKSGMRATAQSYYFETDFASLDSEVSVPVAFDEEDLTADIWPACYDLDQYGEMTATLTDGVTLAVYRIDADGGLTLIASDLENSGDVMVTDPHPSFGVCEYRAVATDPSSGATVFADGSDDSPHQTCAVQWDESWMRPVDEESFGEDGYWLQKSMVDGLYNLQFGEQAQVQSEAVEYIGREHPVSYYGSQKGYKATYQMEFPRSDTQTLSNVRRLMAWRDDVFVREPSGTAFWAKIDSANLTYDSKAAPMRLNLSVSRVDRSDDAVVR